MGLDTVETVIWAEREFGVDIPDVDATEILSAGEFSSYLHEKLLLKQDFKAPSGDKVFARIKTFW
ncbi:hypothetical protein [Cellvibrio sp. PSBB023]|uniref:hypothetical protein n=1 Tax=Cellvibrio sp. PSBB023 TaxID=1945512 RepID=UPI00098EC64A|nr:hypothetical protein [Cellvibrio sp. PSBB023]AQT60814.1 hypothetical protein B0D95_12530 [Cellvibrio sp. PSBB023]